MKKEKIDYTPHPLTRIPGGGTLQIEYLSGKLFTQKNCHYPDRYLNSLIANPEVEPVKKALYEGKLIYTDTIGALPF
jgi:hypothetical protein